MASLAQRVAGRFLTAMAERTLKQRDEGDFLLEYLPTHAAAVDVVATRVREAIKAYEQRGIRFKHKISVQLHGGGQAARNNAVYLVGQNPPVIKIAPKAYKNPDLLHTVIHEFGHYVHDKLAGGLGNRVILDKYRWAMGQKSTGAGSSLDVLDRRMKQIRAEYAALEKTLKQGVPRKGQLYEYDGYDGGGPLRHFKVRILDKAGKRVTCEVLEMTPDHPRVKFYPKTPDGNPIMETDSVSMTYHSNPAIKAQMAKLNEEEMSITNQRITLIQGGDDSAYEAQRHEWAPTNYSRANEVEWFAELCTTHVLGHLKPEPAEWLLAQIR